MKNYFSLTVACIAMFFCSCQKEDLNGTVVNSAMTENATLNSKAAYQSSNMVNYGALIDAPGTDAPGTDASLNFQLNIANKVGVSCLRAGTPVPGRGLVPILTKGYKVLLNFSSNNNFKPAPFVLDINKYQSDLKSILSKFTIMPAVAVIENEESNIKYFSGTAQEYIRQLAAAIPVMHSYGIKVANGGITDVGLNYLVYQDFMSQGKVDSAKDFQQRTRLSLKNLQTQDRGAFIDALLQAYSQMDLDYVNFHWKGTSPDTVALSKVINYLYKRTGKAVINNEIGQFDTDPNTLLSHVQLCANKGLSYIIWYSPDEYSGDKAIPLQHGDQSLTNSGIAYRNYLQK